VACAATIAALVVLATSASAEVRITRDLGGNTDEYTRRVDALRRSGERVVIDGPCNSACTLHLTLPRQQFCVTGRAAFTFHALADTQTGLPRLRETQDLFRAYPQPIQSWINQHGGLTHVPVTLNGNAMLRMLPRCP
jgi:hypothetical protein